MKSRLLMFMVVFNTTVFAQKTITMMVKEDTAPCVGVGPMDCMQVKEGNAKIWTFFYQNIEGFDYEPGYLYKLQVAKIRRAGNIPADASAYVYHLKKVVYKRAVQPRFYLDRKMMLTHLFDREVAMGKVYLTLDTRQRSAFGKSGCNRFNAGWKLNGKNIELSPLSGSLMACDPETMRLEQEFTTAMEQKHFEVQAVGRTVHFRDPKSKKNVMTFNVPTENDVWSFIDGKEWKLIQLDHVGKDYGKSVIRFDLKTKRVSGNSGCNNFFGSFAARENQLSFSGLGATKMACPDQELAATERKVLGYLSDASLRFDLAEQTLNFYKGDTLVMMFGIVK